MKRAKGKIIGYGLVLIVFAYIIGSIFSMMGNIKEKKEEEAMIQELLDAETDRHYDLLEKINKIDEKDEELFEEVARDQLGMVKENEIIFEDRSNHN